jgi:hypothetical protein
MSDNEDKDNFIEFPEYKTKQKKKKIKLPDAVYEKGNELKIIPYETNKNLIKKRPYMIADIIPSHPFAVIFNGMRGSGKTQLCVNLVTRPNFYGEDEKGNKYFDLTYFFSPTGKVDDLVKYLDIDEEKIFVKFDSSELDKIYEEQKKIIEKKGIEKSPKILIIFDDIQSDQPFMRSKLFKQVFFMGRHFNISCILLGQSWTQTPRHCRVNATNIFFFPGSNSEVKLMVDEYTPPRMSKKQFNKLIMDATDENHNFLHINKQVNFKTRFRKNLNIIFEL